MTKKLVVNAKDVLASRQTKVKVPFNGNTFVVTVHQAGGIPEGGNMRYDMTVVLPGTGSVRLQNLDGWGDPSIVQPKGEDISKLLNEDLTGFEVAALNAYLEANGNTDKDIGDWWSMERGLTLDDDTGKIRSY